MIYVHHIDNYIILGDFNLYKILLDPNLTNTEKLIFLDILAISAEQNSPRCVEIPVRTFDRFGITGHGHVKGALDSLQRESYLLAVDFVQRNDGYRVRSVTVNRKLHLGEINRENESEEELKEV